VRKLRPSYVRAFLRARLRRRLRGLLVRYARAAKPSAEELATANKRVVILLGTAWGMGGTIRTVLNVAGYLAQEHEVEIVSVARYREEPFFEPPPGVRVTLLEDQRKEVLAGKLPLLQRWLRKFPSVLANEHDKTYERAWTVWTDVRLVRQLRGRAGYLMGTRPVLNLLAADLDLPGFVTVGQEHMHFYNHKKPLRKAIRERYRKLDTLVVLTDQDRETYERKLRGRTSVVRIPNAVRDMGSGRADLDAPVMLAAGRMSPQKGFDMLVKAWAQVAHDHPDWRLRICAGAGHKSMREKVEKLLAEHDLDGSVSLEPAARDLGGEMDKCSVFVMSSRFEGFPLILLEAMSKGMAVVSFDCPTGPADIIDDHRNGLLVPEKDVSALAVAMGELASDAELRRRVSPAAVETAGTYSMAAIGAQWDDLLRELAPKLPQA
jgi:glycosyltransferase involved in cell wall biosynthesis